MTTKKWYYRKRIWLLVATVLLVYFCFIPSRFHATYETTGLRNPILKDGNVDYFRVYEETYADKFVPPEQNGMRDIIAAFGPVVLEQTHMANTIPWEEMPTNENSKNWFETYWIPLCEHMSIDPYKKPRFYDKRGYYGNKLIEEKAAEKFPPDENNSREGANEKLWKKLVAAPWKAEDEPEVAAWLADYSPALDLFGVAVRKPNYVCWRKPDETLVGILLPDVQSQRDFARNARIRVTERLGRGDIYGAWYDVMSMFHLARHFKKDVIMVTDLVGIAVQIEAMEAAKLILLDPAIDDNHLQRFAADLESLPPNTLVANLAEFEWYLSHCVLQVLSEGKGSEMMNPIFGMSNSSVGSASLGYLPFDWLPIDRNIAGKRLNELQRMLGGDRWHKTPALADSETFEKRFRKQLESFRLGLGWYILRLPLIHTRSKMAAEMIFRDLTPAYASVQTAFNRSTASEEMLRTAIAILRYKSTHNEYPETLDALVPEFLEFYPFNPYTGRANFVYKREPGELQSGTPTPFRLYAVAADCVDDGGGKADAFRGRERVFF
ncbi:MAG: hypothetical protein ACRC46_01645 [Thermoguttaceae bacterium]